MLFPEFSPLSELIRKNSDLFSQYPQNWKEQRDIVQKQFSLIHASNFLTIDDYKISDKLLSFIEWIHYINPSLAIKLGVNYVLFGGALYYLGTDQHHLLLQRFLKGEITGCFAMTEIANGSNLKALGTTIRKVKDSLIINTPTDNAVKVWIGGGTVASHTVVFGQLYDENNTNHGIHAVLVDMHQDGVQVKDMGAKLGLNGVDNTLIRFTNVEVKVDALLSRYGGFVEDRYVSVISDPMIRFGKMLSALSIGRFSIAIGSYAILYKSFVIAYNYNLERTQFDKKIIEYPTQYEKFQKIFKTLHQFRNGFKNLIQIFRKEGISKRVHALSSLLKVYMSWKAIEYTGWCREMCGGHGYLWANQIGMLMNDVNIYQTFEGDNTVLLQQGVKWILSDKSYKSKRKYKLIYLLGKAALISRQKEEFLLQEWNHNLTLIKELSLEYIKAYLACQIPKLEGKQELPEIYLQTIPLKYYSKNYLSKL